MRTTQATERVVTCAGWPNIGLVTVDANGTQIRPETYSAEFARPTRAAGIEQIRLHDARHTAATIMLDAGSTVSTTAKWLGRDPAMTLWAQSHIPHDALESAGASFLGQAAIR